MAEDECRGIGEQVMPNSIMGREQTKVWKLCRVAW